MMAGCNSSFHGFEPCSFQARWSPATVPGTPTDRWLLWCLVESYLPSVSHISGDERDGPTSRKSYDIGSPVAGR